jgi:hypothetical protein
MDIYEDISKSWILRVYKKTGGFIDPPPLVCVMYLGTPNPNPNPQLTLSLTP